MTRSEYNYGQKKMALNDLRKCGFNYVVQKRTGRFLSRA